MRKIIALLVSLIFISAVNSTSLAQIHEWDISGKKASLEAMALALMGTVTKIEGKKITIKQDDGKETTVEVKDVKGIKVGDRVKVKVERGV
jgi:hypothetical protein